MLFRGLCILIPVKQESVEKEYLVVFKSVQIMEKLKITAIKIICFLHSLHEKC